MRPTTTTATTMTTTTTQYFSKYNFNISLFDLFYLFVLFSSPLLLHFIIHPLHFPFVYERAVINAIYACMRGTNVRTNGRTITPGGSNCHSLHNLFKWYFGTLCEMWVTTKILFILLEYRLHTCPFWWNMILWTQKEQQQQCDCTTSILPRKSRLEVVTVVRRCCCHVNSTPFHLILVCSSIEKKKKQQKLLNICAEKAARKNTNERQSMERAPQIFINM